MLIDTLLDIAFWVNNWWHPRGCSLSRAGSVCGAEIEHTINQFIRSLL